MRALYRYASVRAMESSPKLDDEQWLAYWILFIHHALGDGPAAPDLLVDLSRLAAILYIEAHLQIVAVSD